MAELGGAEKFIVMLVTIVWLRSFHAAWLDVIFVVRRQLPAKVFEMC